MDESLYELRFLFLFTPTAETKRPRFILHAPDLVELRWTVFDVLARRTIGYGATPEQAVDSAMERHAKVDAAVEAAKEGSK